MSVLRTLPAWYSLFPWELTKMNSIKNPLGLSSLQCSVNDASFSNLR